MPRIRHSLLLVCAVTAPAYAQDAPVADDKVFDLGQIIIVQARPEAEIAIGQETLSSEAMRVFERVSLDDAANLIPGVTAANSGGSRNERLLFVRGFDRFQVPLSVDGIRVYLPADNRLDFGRFLTPDIAEIQVAKGYPSVLDGPGAMGGAVNLVTRRPTKPLEIEARGTLNLDRDLDYGGYTAFGLIGMRQDRWYAQASYARSFTDHWDLPGSFVATTNEDGGERDFSRTEDWRVNAKFGFTPNATDEYAISYTRQEGSKNAPLHVTDTSNVSLRNWSWPEWNIEGVYFLSTTALDDRATLKTRAYYNRYDNLLRSWDNRQQYSQALGRAFNSPYDDTAYGGSAQLSVDLTPANTLSLAAHYRRDEHNESQTSRPDLPTSVAEPVQTSVEETWSIAAEHRLAFSPDWSLTLGASFDWRDLLRAEEYGGTPAAIFEFPRRDAEAWNAQGRIDWRAEEATNAHFSVSSRARFPTLFERFSSQFGTAEPNPGLKPERATTFELGGAHATGIVRLSGALFYSKLEDALVSVRTPANLNRRENYGSADYYGGEIALDADLSPTLQLGANYGYIHREFEVGAAPAGGLIRPFQLTDVPEHKGFAYISWMPIEGLRLLPSVEFASDRTTVTPASVNGLAPVYYDTGGHILGNFRASFAFADRFEIAAGVRNIFDDEYVLTDGFPEPGRSFQLSARVSY